MEFRFIEDTCCCKRLFMCHPSRNLKWLALLNHVLLKRIYVFLHIFLKCDLLRDVNLISFCIKKWILIFLFKLSYMMWLWLMEIRKLKQYPLFSFGFYKVPYSIFILISVKLNNFTIILLYKKPNFISLRLLILFIDTNLFCVYIFFKSITTYWYLAKLNHHILNYFLMYLYIT